MTTTALRLTHRFVRCADQAARTLLLLHGTGGSEADLIPLGRLLDPTAHLLSPRGAVLENGMARFFRRLAPGVFDEEDLRFRTGELAEFTAAAAREYGFDPARVCAVGFSNGANMAASLLLLAPRVLRDAVLFSPVLPLEPEQRPDLRGVSVFIGAAEDDTVADPASTRKLERVLLEVGADVMTRWKRGGHTITAQDVTAARDWLLT